MEEIDSDDTEYWNNFANTTAGREALDVFEAAGYPRNSAEAVLIALDDEGEKDTPFELLPPRLRTYPGVFDFSSA
jgi:hypothetical protein